MPEWLMPALQPGSWSAFITAMEPWTAIVTALIILSVLGLLLERRWVADAAATAALIERYTAARDARVQRDVAREVEAATGAIEVVVLPASKVLEP